MTRAARLAYRTLLPLMLVGLVATAASAKPSIAILGIEVIDKQGMASPKDTQVAQELTAALRSRAKTGGPYALASGGDKELIDQKLIKNCLDERTACMAVIGADLGADFLLYGRIERSSGAYNVSVVLLDVKRKAREKTYTDAIPAAEASGTTLQTRAKHIYSLLTGQAETCTISVKTPGGPDRAMIFLNEDNQGSGTIANHAGEVPNLAAGRYKVTIVAPDFHRWEKTDVTCTAGQTTSVSADMHRLSSSEDHPAPPASEAVVVAKAESRSSPWRKAAIGGAVATGVFAAGFGVSWGLLASTGASKKPGAGPFEYGGKCTTDAAGRSTGPGLCSSGSTLRITTYVSGIAAVAGFGFTVFALIKAVSEPERHEAVAAGNRNATRAFSIAPVFGLDHVGASAQLSW